MKNFTDKSCTDNVDTLYCESSSCGNGCRDLKTCIPYLEQKARESTVISK